MKHTFYISAIYIGPPSTMGGNTKIMLEIIKNLSNEYHFIVFTTEPDTIRLNIPKDLWPEIIEIPYTYKKLNYMTHIQEIYCIFNWLRNYFKDNPINELDIVYSSSDFAPDVLPLFLLKQFHHFHWMSSLYLFIPSPVENRVRSYGFPFLKYVIYFYYQRLMFLLMIWKADSIAITNDSDKKRFPAKLQKKVYAIYGGVNLEEIFEARAKTPKESEGPNYDVVYCGRLHTQKGISELLDVWSEVIKEIPLAQLAIIGNGEISYELKLKAKATRLKLNKNISWLGFVNGVEKYSVYLRSKLFAHSTIFDNNGMVAAEALCSGLPVVMYDLSSLKEIYELGCVKVQEGDRLGYKNAIVKLLADKILYTRTAPTELEILDLWRTWGWTHRMTNFKTFLEQLRFP